MSSAKTTLLCLATVAVAVAIVGLAGTAHAQAPSRVYLRSLTYAGSGCPAGSVSESFSPDRYALRIHFDHLSAETGPGVPISESRKSCQMSIDLAYPTGWSYSVASVDVSGYVSLNSGGTALEQTRFYFAGSAGQATVRSTFTGPIDRDFHARNAIDPANAAWSPCGVSRALNLSIEVRATGRQAGFIALDSPLDLGRAVRLKWRRCS